jgi:hypothetical protein
MCGAGLLLALLIAGCGGSGGGGGGDTARVRTAVEGWLATLTSGDSARACAHLTPALQRSIDEQLRTSGEKGTCRTFAAKWTGGSTPPGRRGAHVTSVSVSGAKASATLKAPPDLESQVQLRRLGGRWLIQNY